MDVMSFEEAVRNQVIDVFDEDCKKSMKAYKTYSELWIQDYTVPVVGEYLNHLRVYEIEKFNKIMEFILENYLESADIDKKLHDVSAKRDSLTVIDGGSQST